MHFRFKPVKWFHGRCAQLLDKESTTKLIGILANKYSLNVNLGFKTPGNKYFKHLKDADITNLKTYPHLVTTYYGRNAVWLLWLCTFDDVQYSFYINLAKGQIIWSNHRFANSLYKGTIFEGEVIGRKGQEYFLIWDLLVHRNKTYVGNVHQKQAIITEFLSHHYLSDPIIETLTIKARTYADYTHMRSFIDTHVTSDPNHQGILLVPVDRSQKHYTMLFKFADSLSVPKKVCLSEEEVRPIVIETEPLSKESTFRKNPQVFWVAPTKYHDNYELYSMKRNKLVFHELAIITSVEKSERIKELFANDPGQTISGVNHLIKLECRFITRFQKWEPC